MTLVLLAGAMLMLVSGILLQIWSLQPARIGAQYALQLPVVLLYALGGALLLFVSFPDSVSEGRAIGFSLGGAAGFAGFFLISAFAWLSKTRNLDALAKNVIELEKKNESLSRKVAAKNDGITREVPLRHERVLYQLHKARRHEIGFITGDLIGVTGVDVWVNSENTRMQMSRVTEPTISATVRFLGAQKDQYGEVVVDIIADELDSLMSNQAHVAAGQVLVTTAGNIADSHRVRRVLHVAAVEGEPGKGYRPVQNIENCVRAVLSEIDRLNREGEKLRSVLFPLLGTGGGNSDFPHTAQVMVTACADYLLSHRGSDLHTIYLLAHTGAHVAACEDALEEDARLVRRRD
ncbi:macro domain-containing protein [Streptomyces hirsutus]|uniref:macro domain-containing protein n=1 Tax=Streptomyces hirsutus TaxID=35620 RepID=UPI000A605461|nr:macro domain-containing protein [Streptomyces hirsutus]